jgi:hypothetical protein
MAPSLGADSDQMLKKIGEFLREHRDAVQYLSDRKELFEQSAEFSGGDDPRRSCRHGHT